MKQVIRAAGVLGLLALGLFIHRVGGARILALFQQIGWPFLLLVPYRAVSLYLDSRGWRLMFQSGGGEPVPPQWMVFRVAALRESINRLLPVASVGGEIVAIRTLTKLGYSLSATAASVMVEVALTMISLCLFAALGVLVLIQFTMTSQKLQAVIYAGLTAGAVVAIGLIAALRFGTVFERIAHLIERALSQRHADLARAIATIDPIIARLFARPLLVARAIGWQLLGLLTGAVETWLLLNWLGAPVDFGIALGLDSVTWALREFVFVVPAGLGLQEAALTGLGQALGVGADIALTLSLAKRLREFLFGAPVLLFSQRLFRQAASSAAADQNG